MFSGRLRDELMVFFEMLLANRQCAAKVELGHVVLGQGAVGAGGRDA